MDQSTRTGDRAVRLVCGLLASLTLSGCAWLCPAPESKVKTKSETELAVEAIRAEWLKPCEGMAAGAPDNNVGALLQDGTDAMSFLAICMKRHNAFVDYMAPIIAKERLK